MKRVSSILLAMALLTFSWGCSKSRKWDSQLNGSWIEIDASSISIQVLPGGCSILASDNMLHMCGNPYPSVGATVYGTGTKSIKSHLYAEDKQIYQTYKLGLAKNVEFLFDYEFEGPYLWISGDQSETKHRVAYEPGASKFMKQ